LDRPEFRTIVGSSTVGVRPIAFAGQLAMVLNIVV
jgi:hypothetical protein